MIGEQDLHFHKPTSDDPRWAETNYFGLYIPDERLKVGVYALFRPNLGTVLSSVLIFSGYAKNHYDALHLDNSVHLPMPKADLNDYALDNGLHVKALGLMRYQIDYSGYGGTELHFTFEGLMPPYDIHDPNMDPITARQAGTAFDWGAAYSGHFDQTGRVQGELQLKGRSYPIDCVSIMDHSWGVRPESELPSISWFQANFSKELAFHCIFGIDPYRTDAYTSLAHGYVLDGGQVYGLIEGSGRARRDDLQQISMQVGLKDVRGRQFDLTGSAIAACLWNAWPNLCVFNSLNQWNLGGQVGYGESQDALTISYIASGRPDRR